MSSFSNKHGKKEATMGKRREEISHHRGDIKIEVKQENDHPSVIDVLIGKFFLLWGRCNS